MKPFFTIDELCQVPDFDGDPHLVVDALRSAGISLTHNGKEADLSGWERLRPRRNAQGAIVIVRGHFSPPPEHVVVSGEHLPVAWREYLSNLYISGAFDFASRTKKEAAVREWPWGKYETELLRHLSAAAKNFWNLYDPDDISTAPTNAQVADWLRKECKVSDRIAQSMATILRADDLPSGPRK